MGTYASSLSSTSISCLKLLLNSLFSTGRGLSIWVSMFSLCVWISSMWSGFHSHLKDTQVRLTADCKSPIGVNELVRWSVCHYCDDWRPVQVRPPFTQCVMGKVPATLCRIKAGTENNGWIIDFIASVWCQHSAQKRKMQAWLFNYTIAAYWNFKFRRQMTDFSTFICFTSFIIGFIYVKHKLLLYQYCYIALKWTTCNGCC